MYLATKKIGKNNPKEAEIRADNAVRQEWNRTVDVALVEGIPEEDILTVKREKITDKTMQSIRTHGWLPDMFQQIIRGAKDFLQEMIFRLKLPPKPVPKIDLQEWNDMRKLMEKLQKQSQAMKSTQQEISSLKKQLSETTGFFKGKVRKSLEGRIEQVEHLRYLKEYRRSAYLDLLMSGRLNSYLADVEEQAQERFERIVEQMKQAQGITEQLKADNAWEWVGRMNNIQACAREIADKEIIYR